MSNEEDATSSTKDSPQVSLLYITTEWNQIAERKKSGAKLLLVYPSLGWALFCNVVSGIRPIQLQNKK
jgi:hypothetical protein